MSTSLQRFVGGSGAAVSPANAEGNAFVTGMRNLDAELDRSNSAKEVQPFKFVSLFRTAYPMFAAQSEQRGMVKVPPLTAWSPLAVPQRGSGTSSVRAWWLWTARHSQGEARPLWDPSNGLTALEPAASKAHFTAFDHPGRAASSSRTLRSAGTLTRPSSTPTSTTTAFASPRTSTTSSSTSSSHLLAPPISSTTSSTSTSSRSTLVAALAGRMLLPKGSEQSDLPSAPGPLLPRMEALRGNLGDMLFGMEMDVTYRCVETDAEEPYTVRESPTRNPSPNPNPNPDPNPNPSPNPILTLALTTNLSP